MTTLAQHHRLIVLLDCFVAYCKARSAVLCLWFLNSVVSVTRLRASVFTTFRRDKSHFAEARVESCRLKFLPMLFRLCIPGYALQVGRCVDFLGTISKVISCAAILTLCFCFNVFADNLIYINSDKLEVDYGNNVAEYLNNVFVQKKENFDLYCDKAKILYTSEKSLIEGDGFDKGNIKQIEFYDNVTIVRGVQIAKGDFGILYPKEKLIVLSGKVMLKDSKGYLEGSEVRYYVDTGLFKIKNDAVNDEDFSNKKGRVKAILTDNKDNDNKKKKTF